MTDINPKTARISIITPSYNQGRFIEGTIQSVLAQNYPNLEYIIIDGGSTDETLEIIRQYEAEITYWESMPDEGQSHAINKGMARATGDILGWLNSDDQFLPGALDVVAHTFAEAGPGVGAVVGGCHRIDMQGNLLSTRHMSEINYETILHWLNPEFFFQPACLFSREAWAACGPLDQELEYCMDVALWLEMAQQFQFQRIDETLAASIVQPEAKTISRPDLTRAEIAEVLKRHGRDDLAQFHLDVIDRRSQNQPAKKKTLWPKIRSKVARLLKAQ